MFFAILHNQSGQEYVRRLAPNESDCPEYHSRKWIDQEYCGEITISKATGWIPNGCAEYYTEVRRTKKESGSCWASFNFYTESVS